MYNHFRRVMVSLAVLFVLPMPIFAQVINVDDPPYNAVGNGETDDHDAIQNAIWDLRSNGGTLHFTSGKTYIIGSGLTFSSFPETRSYLVTSTGAAKATIKIANGTELSWNHWGFRLSESKNITVKNLVIDGNRDTRNPTVETSGTDVMFIDGASDGTRLVDLDLINSPMDNIYIVVHENQNQVQMTDFEMHNCRLENGFRNNMSVISGANFKIIGCQFINANGTNPQSGIDFEPNNSSTYPYTNMTVEGCLFQNNVRFGIELTKIIEGSGNSFIQNNLFDNNGINIASPNNSIHHNIFVNQVHGNDFGDAEDRDGILYFHANGGAVDNDVFNNYFYDNSMPNGYHLIHFMSNSGGSNHVHDNYGFGNMVEGFVLNDTKPNTPAQNIHDNTFMTSREIGYWNMDAAEIAGNTLNDLSDFMHDGTLVNSPTLVSGAQNEALDFAPDDKYVDVTADNQLNIEMNFTVMAWVKWAGVNNVESEQVIVGRGDDWKFGLNNTGQVGLFAPIPFTAGLVQAPNSIPVNQWKLVTATYDGRFAKLFIDGVEEISVQANGALGASLAHLYLGASNMNTFSFNGVVDDVRIYNYSLSQLEIENIFQAAPLAVEWVGSLSALQQNDQVSLRWAVAQQVDNERFVIEHSVDGIHFCSIGELKGDGDLMTEKSLLFIHENPDKGGNYYRIKQVDYDGKYDFSNIAFVSLPNNHVFFISPNPVQEELKLSTDFQYEYIEVYSQTGQLVKQLLQKNKIQVSDLPQGMYTIRLVGNRQAMVQRFLKTNY